MASVTTPQGHLGAATRDSRWDLVECILGSRSFEHSPRLREMFAYICRRTILESADEVRETEIGIEVFGRSPDFDPAHDTIVRVQMSQLRKKIARYFEEEGAHEPVVLEVAKGNYVPVFRARSAPAPLAAAPEPAEIRPAHPYRMTMVFCAIIATLLTMMGFLVRERSRLVARTGLHNAPGLRLLWSQLLNPTQPTRIVVADTNLAFLSHLVHRGPVRLADYLDRSYLHDIDGLPPDLRAPAEVLLGRQYTGIADAEVTAEIVSLAGGSGVRVGVAYSRDFNVRQFHSANTILLGSRLSNPWVEIFEERLNFQFERSENHVLAIRNRRPLAGEQPAYFNSSATGAPGTSYGVIAFVPNPDRTGNVLVVAGLDMEATEAAGQLLSTEELFGPFARELPLNSGGGLSYFEGLVRTTRIAGAVENLKVVAYRKLVF